MHLLLYFLFSIHSCCESLVHVVRIVFPDINVLQSLPINSVPYWLAGGPVGGERIQPFVWSEDLFDVSRGANVPLAMERPALLLQILYCRFVLNCQSQVELEKSCQQHQGYEIQRESDQHARLFVFVDCIFFFTFILIRWIVAR